MNGHGFSRELLMLPLWDYFLQSSNVGVHEYIHSAIYVHVYEVTYSYNFCVMRCKHLVHMWRKIRIKFWIGHWCIVVWDGYCWAKNQVLLPWLRRSIITFCVHLWHYMRCSLITNNQAPTSKKYYCYMYSRGWHSHPSP